MPTSRHFICFAFLLHLTYGFALAAPTPQTIPLLLSEEVDEKNALLPLPIETAKLIHYLETTLNLKFEERRYPWKRALENAQKGEGLIYGISKTPERLRRYIFSEAIFTDQTWLITRCDSTFPFNTLQDLKGKTIGIVRGASSGEEFDQLENILFKVEDDTGANQGRFNKLYNKRMDALIFYRADTNVTKLEADLNKMYAQNFLSKRKTNGPVFCVLPRPVSAISIHIAIAQNQDTTILKKIDKAILQGRRNGELTRIFSQDNQIKQ